MTTIISGNFKQQDEAQQTMTDLAAAGFAADQMATFYVTPAGQHDLTAVGGDEDASPGLEDAGSGATSGAAIGGAVGVAVGIATLPVLGPGAAVAAAGVGAYVGSLYGALGNMDNKNEPETPAASAELRRNGHARKSGMLVAVAAAAAVQQDTAIRIMRAHGATDIERPDGTIVAGDWTDFNPLAPVHQIEA